MLDAECKIALYLCGLETHDDGLPDVYHSEPSFLIQIRDILLLSRGDQLRYRFSCLFLRSGERGEVHADASPRANVFVHSDCMIGRRVQAIQELRRYQLGVISEYNSGV